MSATFDVSGRWLGHYPQHGREHGIAADLVQQGVTFTGTMSDHKTESERTLTQAAQEFGWVPGADEQVFEWVRQQIPEAEKLPVQAVSNMPEASLIEGTV